MADRLLAINFGGIGDEILFLPVLASIKEALPDTHITLLLEPRSKAIKDVTNLIDDVKLFDIKKRPLLPKDYFELLQIIRSGNYQTVLSSGSTPLVACLLFASGIKKRIGYDSGPLSRLLLSRAVKLNRNQYAADMYHDLVQDLDVHGNLSAKRSVIPQIKASSEHLDTMRSLVSSTCSTHLANKAIKRVIIHPGTSRLAVQKGIIKTWPADNWAALISELLSTREIQVILAGGPDDQQTIREIEHLLKESSEFAHASAADTNLYVSAYGKTRSLADLAALIDLSDLLICVDSAPMHIGVALNKPLLALFGPTKPAHLLPAMPIYRYLIGQITQTGQDEQRRLFDQDSPVTAIGVQLPPSIVYQSALDLLKQVKVR